VLPNTPENIGGVLDAGIRMYRANFRVLTQTAALLFGGNLAVSLVAVFLFGVNIAPADPTSSTLAELYTLPFVALSIVGFLIATLTYSAVLRQLQACASGAPLTIGASVREGVGRMIPVTVALVLYVLLTGIGFLLLAIPGIWLATATGFAIVFAAEGAGPISAIRQSMSLVKGHWWRTTAVFAVIFLLVFVVSLVFGGIPGGIAGYNAAATGEMPSQTFQLISMIANTLGSIIAIPIGFAMTYAAFHDLKLRASGEDLESRLGSLEG